MSNRSSKNRSPSDVQRWAYWCRASHGHEPFAQSDGEFVLWDDYERLARELEARQQGIERLAGEFAEERERLRDRLLNRVNLCACHYATSNRPSDCATCKQDREILSEATDSSVETAVSLSPEDEKRIGESERELAVLKKDGRSYKTRRVAGQALEAITLLKAKTASPLDWMECPVTKEPCNCHGFCKRMAESSEKANCVHQSRQACAKCGWNDDEQRFDVL